MNEFIEQFLIESREHVEQATADLLALEKVPEDKASLDSAFRAFHTLKGGAGIVDFDAMAHAIHAAEDVLANVRSGTQVITTRLIGDCLTCLDQVVQWLDTMQSTGELPPHAQAQVQAQALVARFSSVAGNAREPVVVPHLSEGTDWLEGFLALHPGERSRAKVAIRYVPKADCFYSGEDPIGIFSALPGLLALDLAPASPWPSLDEIDPFACNLILTALAETPEAEVIQALGAVAQACDVRALASQGASAQLSGIGRDVLEAQLLLLAETAGQGAPGRIASAGAVAANVLRCLGADVDAERLEHATQASLAVTDARALRKAIDALLHGSAVDEATPAIVAGEAEGGARTLRIDAARVDALVNLTGELTVAKNAIGHVAKLVQEGDQAAVLLLKHRYAVLDRLIGELQLSVLGMRVLPLRHVFQRFPRLLREIAGDLGKPAVLVLEGGETEADKAIVEMLFEPLLHVIRNALGHGIEDAATRIANRKPPIATIRLWAERQGDNVIVSVSDDGGGIDLERVRHVALARGVVTEGVLADMGEKEVTSLIFEPGFSTAQDVTGMSGRGVGMDAVRAAITRIGGSVDVRSLRGAGTTIAFTLPFSVMLARVMVVSAAGQEFGIPLDAVIETVRIGFERITSIGAAQAVVLRNQTVPVVSLAHALGLNDEPPVAGEAMLVVSEVDGYRCALRVDRVGERMEVMLKPLDGFLEGARGLAGSTLLGDGSVLLVLDLGELFQ